MNLYVRYFAHEALVQSVEEAIEFLRNIQEIKVDQSLINRISTFYEGTSTYPYHLKVSYNNYVIIIKTDATSMEMFKEYQQRKHEDTKMPPKPLLTHQDRRHSIQEMLNEPRPGWYEAGITFKRVVLIPETSKYQYKDTVFRARLKAESAIDCYNRMIDHLRNRQDVDPRSQFPSSKSSNFVYNFLGTDEEINQQKAAAEAAAKQEEAPAEEAPVAETPAPEIPETPAAESVSAEPKPEPKSMFDAIMGSQKK